MRALQSDSHDFATKIEVRPLFDVFEEGRELLPENAQVYGHHL